MSRERREHVSRLHLSQSLLQRLQTRLQMLQLFLAHVFEMITRMLKCEFLLSCRKEARFRAASVFQTRNCGTPLVSCHEQYFQGYTRRDCEVVEQHSPCKHSVDREGVQRSGIGTRVLMDRRTRLPDHGHVVSKCGDSCVCEA